MDKWRTTERQVNVIRCSSRMQCNTHDIRKTMVLHNLQKDGHIESAKQSPMIPKHRETFMYTYLSLDRPNHSQ